MSECRILILTALLPEGRAVAKALKLKKVAGPLTLWRGGDVAVAVVGMQGVKLAEVLKIPEVATPKAIIMAGLAGGLASELKIGAVVADGKPLPPSVINGTGVPAVRVGRVHTSEGIVTTPAAKAKLLAETGCIAVDMETAIARRFAAKQSAVFATIRSISDTVRDTLDPVLLTLIDDEGRVKTGSVVKLLLRQPGKMKELLALRNTSRMALASLSEVLVRLVASNWPAAGAKKA